ncbi:MAG: class I SAM-dependent methyltransferase [Candidatus Micrarchaeia archaeon]|jgi:tRNA (guanine37-N1)-methyltransferase
MKCLIVNKRNAEKAKKYLLKQRLLNKGYKVFSRKSFIYFPILDGAENNEGIKRFGAIGEAKFEKSVARIDYKAELERILGEGVASKGYDLLGNIAIIDAEPKVAKKIGKLILSLNKNVETVLRKKSAVKGRYRKREYAYVLGKRNYVAHYKENGSIFEFDVRKVFFSPRLAYERQRIASLVRENEHVMVMFAGVGPFAIEIAKKAPTAKVVAIELNRYAYKYMLKNIELNKVKNVEAVLGDVKTLSKKYKGFADRIVMPLPKESYHFLDSAYLVAKKKAIVHYYTFVDRGNTSEAEEKIKKFFKKYGTRIEILDKRMVRPYSAHEIEMVVDFLIIKARQRAKNAK